MNRADGSENLADPFVHHNSLSTATQSRVYHPSTHSTLPAAQRYVQHTGQTMLNHNPGATFYPDPPNSIVQSAACHADCGRCHSRRRDPSPHICPCCQLPVDHGVSEILSETNHRNRSSSRSGEDDVYRRHPHTRHSSHGRRDSIRTRVGFHPKEHTPSPDRQQHDLWVDEDVGRGRRRDHARSQDDFESRMANLNVDYSPLRQQGYQSSAHQHSRSRSRERCDGCGQAVPVHSLRAPNLQYVAEGLRPDPVDNQVFPLQIHEFSPTRQHKRTYKGHRPAALDSYSKLRRDLAKPRGMGRD